MKSLKQIREASGGKEAYQKFFNSLLKKFGVSSPSELSGDKKKKFYDALDAGWDGDNEKPEKNERHADPENLDPETTVDGDEDQADKAASHVTEALSKLIGKAGRGKLSPRDAIDIDYMGDRKDIKFDSTKWKINIKGSGDGQALVSGEKKKIIAWLTSDDYGMDDEDIEDLFPELLESRFPKALSIIRQNKVSGDALEEAYDMNEKMVMCEHCGKMHEEGACGEMKESEIHLDKLRAAKFAPKSKWAALKKKFNVKVDPSDPRWVAGKPKDLHKFAMAMGMSKNDIKKTYNHITPEYKGASNITNKQRDESVEEAFSMRSIGLKGASKRSRETGRKAKEGPALKGAKLGKSQPVLNRSQENEIHKIANKHSGDMEKAMKEIEKMRVWKGKGIQDHPYVMDVLKKANETYDYGSDKAVKAAKKKTPGQNEVNEKLSKGQMAHDKEYMHKKLKGNNNKSMKISTAKALKIKVDGDTLVLSPKQDKLAQKHKVTIRNDKDGDLSVWGKGDDVHKFMAAMGQRVEANEGVNVDRRTKGFKEALKRQEAAKIKREKVKAKKEKKKHQAELDARYDYDGEVNTVLAAANSVMLGKKLPEDAAANSVASGNVDMAPNMGKKKKKDKDLMARRSY